jgi:hypothetical protein
VLAGGSAVLLGVNRLSPFRNTLGRAKGKFRHHKPANGTAFRLTSLLKGTTNPYQPHRRPDLGSPWSYLRLC